MLAQAIVRAAKIRIAQLSFWEYCKLISPDFYKESRPHLKEICDKLQDLYEGKLLKPDGTPYKKLMLNVPPQHGKSRSLVNFADWVFGKNNKEKIITCSYNDSVASDFSKYTRDGIMVEKLEDNDIVYSDIFPDTRIKKGTSAFEKWALDGAHFSYLGAGVGGSVTSKGATILIVDDPVKSAEEALNENNLEKIWLWYTSTFRSRVAAEKGEPIEIICMTRWSKNDICGKLLNSPMAKDWYQIKMEATDQHNPGIMLCEDLFSLNRYLEQKALVFESIFNANYHQKAIELEGALFKLSQLKRFRRSDLHGEPDAVLAYADIADEGTDYFSAPFAKIYGNRIYITDILFTPENVDYTLPSVVGLINKAKTDFIRIESNNQGSVFAKMLRQYVDPDKVLLVTNSANKHTRILMEQLFIVSNVYLLHESEYEKNSDYDKFMENLLGYMKDGSSKNDDAPDSLAGLTKFIRNYLPHLFE